MGFFSNDFGNQGGSPGEIDACTAQYAVTFEQFQIDHVINGAGYSARPVFNWLMSQPGYETAWPTWNFHKYLISREGKLVATWSSPADPGVDNANDPNDIPSRIAEEVAKP